MHSKYLVVNLLGKLPPYHILHCIFVVVCVLIFVFELVFVIVFVFAFLVFVMEGVLALQSESLVTFLATWAPQ